VHGQEDILRERFSHDPCGTCGATQRREDVIVLAHRGPRWLVLVTCHRCQRRGIFIATFPQSGQTSAAQGFALDTGPHALTTSKSDPAANEGPSLTPLSFSSSDTSPITLNDVDAMRRFLLSFNGDFRTLFGGASGEAG
jgi:hypothetical protein